MPGLERERRSVAAAFFNRPLVVSAGRMGINAVRLAERDVDVSAIGHPARLAGGEMLVGVGNTRVVLIAELVLGRLGIRVPAQPELLDELVALFIVSEALECFRFFVGDDPANVLVQPLLVFAAKLGLR